MVQGGLAFSTPRIIAKNFLDKSLLSIYILYIIMASLFVDVFSVLEEEDTSCVLHFFSQFLTFIIYTKHTETMITKMQINLTIS